MEVPKNYLPLALLEAIARMAYEGREDNEGPWSDRRFAAMCGVSNKAVGRWRAAGGLVPWTTADTASVNLGLHPLSVWPEHWGRLDAKMVAGIDRKAIRDCEKAIEQVGLVLDARKTAAA